MTVMSHQPVQDAVYPDKKKVLNRYVCIHGHFYQPPRENAWLEEVERQDSADPYHDWNERITSECYGPNSASRILDGEGHIVEITNNYSKISFNFGATLLSWMEKHDPRVYRAIQEADQLSQQRFNGHGSALAQNYNHIIMPLANARDKQTQVRWGIADFEHRFGRKPEGMWLAETATNTECLEVLAEHGIKFTILAPRQCKGVRALNGGQWMDVSGGRVDPRRPYIYNLPSGKKIVLFFYDGPISQALAFEKLLNSGEMLAGRLTGALAEDANWPHLVHIATDGETYGHHHQMGDMALAYCLSHIESDEIANITIYGEFLEQFPPDHECQIWEDSSWSCVHGVERWRSNCGCSSGMHGGWNQEWRAPLRQALDQLRDALIPMFEKHAEELLKDPWAARDAYINIILDRSPESVEAFLNEHGKQALGKEERIRVLKLLEIQRNALLMYTSCGWFFDELSGLETTQVLQYACRALQLAKQFEPETELEGNFIEALRKAPSNISDYQNGAWIYENFVMPTQVSLLRVGAHYAISSLFEDYEDETGIYCYQATRQAHEQHDLGHLKLALGRAKIQSRITLDETEISYSVLHFGDQNLTAGVREFMGLQAFEAMRDEIKEAFHSNDVPEVLKLINSHFEDEVYSFYHLFRDQQGKILEEVFRSTLEEMEASVRGIYERHYPMVRMLQRTGQRVPKVLATTCEFVLNQDLVHLLEEEFPPIDRIRTVVADMRKVGISPNASMLKFKGSMKIEELFHRLEANPRDLELIEEIRELLVAFNDMKLDLDLWDVQNRFYVLSREILAQNGSDSDSATEEKRQWIEAIKKFGEALGVRVD